MFAKHGCSLAHAEATTLTAAAGDTAVPPIKQQEVAVADAGKRSTTCGEGPLKNPAVRGTAVARPSLLVTVEKAGSGSGAAIVANSSRVWCEPHRSLCWS